MSNEYDTGFSDGYEFAIKHYNPHSGRMTLDYPDTFFHRQGAYNCGFGEGLISGRGQKMHDVFGKFSEIYWKMDKQQ